MDPEISSCPDSPDRDPSLEFCNDWEEPRDLLLKAGFKSRIFKKRFQTIFGGEENSENLQSFEFLNCRTTTDWDCIGETADPGLPGFQRKNRLVGHATTSWLAEWAVAGVARSSSAAWKGFFPSFPGVFVIQVLKAEMASWSSWWDELCPNDLLLQLYVNYDILKKTIN